MQVQITQPIVDALKTLHDVPDELGARIGAIVKSDGGYTLKLSEDEATAMAELVQWHIKTDPVSGKPTAQSKPFDDLIRMIDQAMFE